MASKIETSDDPIRPIHYLTSIRETDTEKVLVLIDSAVQAYRAFDDKHPTICRKDRVTPPDGYEFVDCWSGVDELFGRDKTVECYGVVFRTKQAPYTYIFSFRGTASLMDGLDDAGAMKEPFVAYDESAHIPSEVEVEAGFNGVYRTADGATPSMQTQVFRLLDQYQASDKKIDRLLITGHSLGAAVSQLFTLDVALSRPHVAASTINFAAPRVGNAAFVDFFMDQPAQQDPKTRTLRVQNVYDKVPCVPPQNFGYRHTPYAYAVAFYRDEFLGRLNLLDDHSSNNYRAVLHGAAKSETGICVAQGLDVPANGYAIDSEIPDLTKICNFPY